ncbi:MAG: hypothetical protein KDH19_10960 [Geminicoccaceae bacterium]|nr:hypothetical protein [Geminicoccaceae bacterium]
MAAGRIIEVLPALVAGESRDWLYTVRVIDPDTGDESAADLGGASIAWSLVNVRGDQRLIKAAGSPDISISGGGEFAVRMAAGETDGFQGRFLVRAVIDFADGSRAKLDDFIKISA